MAKNPPDERLVYLALKNIFKGTDAQARNPKTIRKSIQKHQTHPGIRSLIHEHSIENVCNTAKLLLEQQIFESTLKAKIRFPEVFEVSPAQSAERAASEAEAAKTEADAIKGAAEGQAGPSNSVEKDEKGKGKGKGKERQICVSLIRVRFSAPAKNRGSFPGLNSSIPETFFSTCDYLCSIALSRLPASQDSTSTPRKGTRHSRKRLFQFRAEDDERCITRAGMGLS